MINDVSVYTLCGGLKMPAPMARSPYGVGSRSQTVFGVLTCILIPLLLINYVIFVPSYCELPCKFCQCHFLVKIMCKHVLWCLREYTPLNAREQRYAIRRPPWPPCIEPRAHYTNSPTRQDSVGLIFLCHVVQLLIVCNPEKSNYWGFG